MATITEREGAKGITFQVRYRIDGKQKTKSFNSKREANKFAKEVEAKKTLGMAKDESSILFKDYAIDFFKIHNQGLATSTIRAYGSQIKKINRFIGNKKLKEIKSKDIDNMFLSLREKGTKNSSLKFTLIVLNFVLNAAFEDDLILFNPTLKIKFKFREDVDENKIISGQTNVDEKFLTIDKIRQAIDIAMYKGKYDLAFSVMILFATGMRFGEHIGWTLDDINLEKRQYIVCRQVNKFNEIKPTKNKKTRVGYIGNYLEDVLSQIFAWHKKLKIFYDDEFHDKGIIICKSNGDYLNYSTYKNRFNDFFGKHLDFKFTPHMLRHTFATLLKQANIKDVQQLMGHSNPEITEKVYQHFDDYSPETIELINSKITLIN
jgi:integrase